MRNMQQPRLDGPFEWSAFWNIMPFNRRQLRNNRPAKPLANDSHSTLSTGTGATCSMKYFSNSHNRKLKVEIDQHVHDSRWTENAAAQFDQQTDKFFKVERQQ
ncbi:Intermembrane lipid transfer protein [Trichinella spiralis]|uniref:Intermembrane lipid transfer protein n=1 Tax=Trichinella spiralis TaxID=6334 RepID=A0ABR3KVF9_TRISP